MLSSPFAHRVPQPRVVVFAALPAVGFALARSRLGPADAVIAALDIAAAGIVG